MKQIEILLQRYAEGVITPEEQSELNKLTHRDDVLHSASIQALYPGHPKMATIS